MNAGVTEKWCDAILQHPPDPEVFGPLGGQALIEVIGGGKQ